MPDALIVRPGYMVLGAAVAASLYGVVGRETSAQVPPAPEAPRQAIAMTKIAPPPTLDTSNDDDDDFVDESAIEIDDETIHGLASIDDPAEFAMVFSVDGDTYLRLSSEERATSRGRARLVTEGADMMAVVAPVTASALPADFKSWVGRTVLVDGTCKARVVGFAEVSRVSGDPPGSDEYYYAEESERPAKKPEWNMENIVDANVTLAAKLDGCDGTWARSTELSPAEIAHEMTAPELESAALADLLAKNEYDPLQEAWKETGGEGDWRDVANIDVKVFQLGKQRWVFASASTGGGGCGEPSASAMAAYRVGADSKLRRATDLNFAGRTIQGVIDLDGDGQPELLVDGYRDGTELVDLKNESHDSMEVPYYTWGCGC